MNDAIETLREFFATKAPTTQRGYSSVLNQFVSFLGRHDIDHLSVHECIRFIRQLQATRGRNPRPGDTSTTISKGTLAYKVSALTGMYDYLLRCGLAQQNPWRDPALDQHRKRGAQKFPHERIPNEMVEKVLAAPSRHTPEGRRDRAILACLFYGALRRSEVAALNIGDVTAVKTGIALKLRNTKNGNTYIQPLPIFGQREIRAALRDRQGASLSEPLFVEHFGARLTDNRVYKLFKMYCAVAGLGENFSPHCARASAITRLLELGVEYRKVQQFSRHASIKMVELYDKRRLELIDNPAKLLRFGNGA